MSIFSDRRSLQQIGGLRAYLRQVSWSLRWQLGWRRRVRRTLDGPRGGAAASAHRRRPSAAPPRAGEATARRRHGAGSR